MLMVFNSKLNLCTYLAQGNLCKNSNAIEQASSVLFCFVFARLTQYTFLSKKTDYFNTVTQQLLLMPLQGTILFGTQIFLQLLLCFSNLYLFALNHTNRTKSQRFTLFQRRRFCQSTRTRHQQEVVLEDRQTSLRKGSSHTFQQRTRSENVPCSERRQKLKTTHSEALASHSNYTWLKGVTLAN